MTNYEIEMAVLNTTLTKGYITYNKYLTLKNEIKKEYTIRG